MYRNDVVHGCPIGHRVSRVDPPGHRSSSSAAWGWKAPRFRSIILFRLVRLTRLHGSSSDMERVHLILLTRPDYVDFTVLLGFPSLPPWWIRFAVAACVCFERDRTSSLFGNGLYSPCCPCCLMRAGLSSRPSSLTSLLGKNYILFLNDRKLSSDPATPDGAVPGCVVCVLRRAGCLKVGEAWRRISACLLYGVEILICISLCFAAICENLLFARKTKYNFKRIYKQLRNHARPLSVCPSISQRPFFFFKKNAFCDIISSI